MPTFLNKVLDMPITKTGMSAIIPPTTQLVVKLLAGWSSDKITCISVGHLLSNRGHVQHRVFSRNALNYKYSTVLPCAAVVSFFCLSDS